MKSTTVKPGWRNQSPSWFYFFALLLICFASTAQKLPVRLNMVDGQQRRQGPWAIWMDARWQATEDSTRTVYYRLIHYKDDKPVGVTADYYRNGQKQYEGILLADRPEEILDGVQTWYYPAGQKRIIEIYKNGEPTGEAKVLLRSGVPADESWIDHYKKGEKLSDENKYAASVKEFLVALENAEAFFGRESEEYATVADWLGIVNALDENRAEAIRFKKEFVEVRKVVRQPPDTLMASTLADLGTYSKLEKNWADARNYFTEFLTYNARFFKGKHPSYAEAIQTYGTVCEALHEYDAALHYLTEAKKIFDAHPDQYEYPRLSNIFSLSSLYLTIGDFAKGEQILTAEIKELKKKYGEKSELYTIALGSLARIHVGAGQYFLAEKEWLEQIAIIKTVNGGQSEAYASGLGSLAELYAAMGNLPEADRIIQQARKIYLNQKLHDESYLEFLQKLSLIYSMMGNRQAMLETAMNRKELALQIFGPQSLSYARTLISLVDVAFLEKNWTLCITLAKSAVAIYSTYDFNSLNERERTSIALLRSRLATVYMIQLLSKPSADKLTDARREVEEAIRIFNSLPEQAMSMEIADTYLTLAMVYEWEHNTRKADQYYTFVLDKVRKQFGETHPYLIDVLFLVAKKSEIRKDYAASLRFYKQAIDQHQRYIQDVFPYLSELEKEQFYGSNKLMLGSFQGFATQYSAKVPGLSEVLCNVILSQKGIILESFQPIREAIFASGDKALGQTFSSWQETKNEYARMLQVDAGSDSTKLLAGKLNDLEKDITLKAKSLNLDFRPPLIQWTDIQKKLKTGEAAVEIIYTVEDRIDGYDSAYHAVIIKPGLTAPLVVRLSSANAADGKSFRYYRNSIASRLEDKVSYQTYWAGMASSLEGIHTVYVSADGIYHQVSLGALFNPETGKFLTDEKYIVMMPSTTWLLREGSSSSTLKAATFFAHPTYGTAVPAKTANLSRSLDLESISELPGTEKELADLVALMDRYKISYEEFEGNDATEEKIKALKKPSVLHIATHGYFLPSANAGDQFKNPLLQSGLLLARCQLKPHLADPQNEDGVLTAYEASTLPLYNTNLVILSACETGLGEVRNGEGVYGLQRAFLMAGARRVLMSLWKVDDEATHQFMVVFYEEWIRQGSIDKAYQSAQKSVRKTFPDPHYWAAFVLNGF